MAPSENEFDTPALEEALQEVGETLERPSARAAVGAMGWVFPSALQAETEMVLRDTAKVHELQGREEALGARISALEVELRVVKPHQSPSLAAEVKSESEEDDVCVEPYSQKACPAVLQKIKSQQPMSPGGTLRVWFRW